jgi:hypothetical protein
MSYDIPYERVRLKGKTQPMLLGDNLVMSLGERHVKLSGFVDADAELVQGLMNGLSTELLGRLTAGDGRIIAFVRQLWQAGMLENGGQELPPDISPADAARFDRLLHHFAEFEDPATDRYEYLRRLRNSRVAVVGLGGMGSWVLYNLACSGVGTLVLVDPDVVEASNLSRAILYTESDVGRPKAVAAAAALTRFAPRTTVQPIVRAVTGADALAEMLPPVDLVVGLADQPLWLIREWIARAGARLRTPVLQANGGMVGPFQLPSGSSCAMCVWAHTVDRHPGFPAVVAAQRRIPRRTSGAVSAWPSFTSGVVAMEALRYLAGYRMPMTVNAVWEARLTDFTAAVRPLERHPACVVCSEASSGSGTDSSDRLEGSLTVRGGG